VGGKVPSGRLLFVRGGLGGAKLENSEIWKEQTYDRKMILHSTLNQVFNKKPMGVRVPDWENKGEKKRFYLGIKVTLISKRGRPSGRISRITNRPLNMEVSNGNFSWCMR